MSRFIILLSVVLVVLVSVIQEAKAINIPYDQEFNILDRHNEHRAKHHSPPLLWDKELSFKAQQWSNKCKFASSQGSYGENISLRSQRSWNATVDFWYNEVGHYNFQSPGFNNNTHSFTQLVWKGTKQVGCGISNCKYKRSNLANYVCFYLPRGNVLGNNPRTGKSYFEENVLPQ